jgi:multiple antibiotic resistance protein
MTEYTTFFILAFSTLFTLVNPIGLTAVYLSIVEHFEMEDRNRIALRGTITAFVILIMFSLIGDIIFSFYQITVSAFKIAGGILFFRTGIQMLEARVSRSRSTPKEKEEAETKEDIAYTPIGMPLIAGPGAITSIMILSSETPKWELRLVLFVVIALVLLLTYIIFQGADYLTQRFGTTGLRIIQRIMGLILMVIAVQFIIDGIEVVIKGWLNLS